MATLCQCTQCLLKLSQLAECNARQTTGSPIRIRIVSAGNEKDKGEDVKRDTAVRADAHTLTHKEEESVALESPFDSVG